MAIGVTLAVLILSANPATAASSNQNEPAASNGVVSEACKVISYVDEFDSLKNIVRLLSDGDSKSSVLGTVISAIDYLACPLAAIERPALRLRTSLQSMYHFEPPRATYDPVGVPSVCFSSSGPNVMWVQWLQTTVGAQPTTVEIEWKYADSGFWSSPSVLSYTAGFHEDWARSYVGSPSTSVDVRIERDPRACGCTACRLHPCSRTARPADRGATERKPDVPGRWQRRRAHIRSSPCHSTCMLRVLS